MQADELIDRARKRTGLADFGEDAFREGLDVLVISLNSEAELNELGRQALTEMILTNLANRSRVTEWVARHPEVAEEAIERPIFIIGPPRTGTTLLSRLLHQDPQLRSLMKWEAQNSVPPPEAATFACDPRIAEAERDDLILDQVNPALKTVHSNLPDGPTECIAVLAQDFKCNYWESAANIPTYSAWLADCDYTSAYEYHRRVLQLLQSKARGQWSLKGPAHRLAIDTLADTYPDAFFIETHRDPVTVVASMCSLITSVTETFSDAHRRPYIAGHWTGVLEQMSNRVDAFRDRHEDARFLDLQYTDLLADPIAAVRRVYDHVGRELPPEVEAKMAAYLTANPQGKYGRHVYSLDDLCLDRDEIETRFSRHVARYEIPREEVA
jgi:Sulfotransferase family